MVLVLRQIEYSVNINADVIEMKASSKVEKAYRVQGDRTTQEQIRKRRHNLFKRLKEFNDRYEIEIWLTMRMPSGRIYTFATNPNEPVPSDEEIVSYLNMYTTGSAR